MKGAFMKFLKKSLFLFVFVIFSINNNYANSFFQDVIGIPEKSFKSNIDQNVSRQSENFRF